LHNENAPAKTEVTKPKQQKKNGKIVQVYKLHQRGVGVKDIAEKLKLSERIVRAYIWRMKNPEKYAALVQRYFEKKRQNQENEAMKAAVANNGKPAPSKKEEKKQKAKAESQPSP
jgi:hypothetical protein